MSDQITNKKGFTLIEIVIVLAIAALILAGIFVAVSGAQESRRDEQRKNDNGSIASLLEQSASNFNGNYPGCAAGPPTCDTVANFNTKYLAAGTTNMRDPSDGAIYVLPAPAGGIVTCPAWTGEGDLHYGLNGRRYQLCVDLESGDSSPARN